MLRPKTISYVSVQQLKLKACLFCNVQALKNPSDCTISTGSQNSVLWNVTENIETKQLQSLYKSTFKTNPTRGPPFKTSKTWNGFNKRRKAVINSKPWQPPLFTLTKTSNGSMSGGSMWVWTFGKQRTVSFLSLYVAFWRRWTAAVAALGVLNVMINEPYSK